MIRWIALILVFAGLTLVGGAAFIESPSGERVVSGWLTGRLRKDLPGVEVSVQGIHLQFPRKIEVAQARFRDSSRQPVLVLKGPSLTMSSWRRLAWRAQAVVESLDLAGADRLFGKGEWRSRGILKGSAGGNGVERRMQGVQVELDSAGGGELRSDFLTQMLSLMPANDQRAILLRAVGAKETFHFATGRVDFTMGPAGYDLHLQVDGDHRLDITLRLPAGGLALLKTLASLRR